MTNALSNPRLLCRAGAMAAALVLVAAIGPLAVAAPAEAQAPPADVAATCGDLAVLSIPEGPRAIEAAESLRSRGAPNPPGIEAALDVVVAAADPDTESPPVADVDAALATLNDYYGGACAGLERCAFVAQIAGDDGGAAAQAAHLLRRIETPAPPGIDAALALIAGDVAESPFHADVAEARAQVLDYYPCGAAGGGGETEGGATGGAGAGGELALTGSSTTLLSAIGAALVALGAIAQLVRRRLVPDAV